MGGRITTLLTALTAIVRRIDVYKNWPLTSRSAHNHIPGVAIHYLFVPRSSVTDGHVEHADVFQHVLREFAAFECNYGIDLWSISNWYSDWVAHTPILRRLLFIRITLDSLDQFCSQPPCFCPPYSVR